MSTIIALLFNFYCTSSFSPLLPPPLQGGHTRLSRDRQTRLPILMHAALPHRFKRLHRCCAKIGRLHPAARRPGAVFAQMLCKNLAATPSPMPDLAIVSDNYRYHSSYGVFAQILCFGLGLREGPGTWGWGGDLNYPAGGQGSGPTMGPARTVAIQPHTTLSKRLHR